MAFSDEQKKKMAMALVRGRAGITKLLTDLKTHAPKMVQVSRDALKRLEENERLKATMTPTAYKKLVSAQRGSIEYWERLSTVEGACDFVEMWLVMFTEGIITKTESSTSTSKEKRIQLIAIAEITAEKTIQAVSTFRAANAS